MEPIKVLLADDHPLFRRGLAAGLAGEKGIRGVGEAGDGLEAVQRAEALAPDVVVLDLQMPRGGGLEATRAIRERMPQVNVLVLTVSDRDADLFAAIKAGAKGYLLKQADPDEVVKAIFHVAAGEAIISPVMAAKLLKEFDSTPKRQAPRALEAALSDREREVLQLVVKGHTNKEIAEALVIAENTVKSHLRSILDKLQVRSRGQAAVYAIKAGLVEEPEPGEKEAR